MQVIDSHTGGEPTRIVTGGGPDLGSGTMAEQLSIFQRDHDAFRSAVVNEPRGSDFMVGGLLTEQCDPSCIAGVLFFNNVGVLGMCGHGTIGLIATLAYLGRIGPGSHRIDTPVGDVTATLHEDGRVSVRNVASYRWARDVRVSVARYGDVVGDVAYGGNWFFLVKESPIPLVLANVEALVDFTWVIRQALAEQGITGRGGSEIDHVEVFAPSPVPGADSRGFVLCPGKAYDRSPCGTGTSAKLACLSADGKLAEGQIWRQESIVGSIFEGTVERDGDSVIPTISGTAFVNAESTLILNPVDPFCFGIR